MRPDTGWFRQRTEPYLLEIAGPPVVPKELRPKHLLVHPGIAGTVKTRFDIRSDGMVTKPTASGVHKKVARCVAGVLQSIKFPKPKGGGTVSVKYEFRFKPGKRNRNP